MRGKMWTALMTACALLVGGSALADSRDWLTSQVYGQIRLASYADGFDGYLSVDGYGGETAEDPFCVTVISKNASVWSEPKTNGGKIGSVSHGETLSCRSSDGGQTVMMNNGFYAVQYKGKNGWINEDYVVRNTLEITLMESNVPAYIAPDPQSKKVGSLSKQTTYRVIGFYDDFYIINLRDAAAAYIPMSVRHYDTAFSARYRSGSRIGKGTTNGSTELRTGPGKEYAEIRTLSAGESFDVLDFLDGWALVQDTKNGTYAFIGGDALTMN